MSLQSERVTFAQQNVFISNTDKIKISTSDLYYANRDKLEAYFVQINLYVKRHESQFRNTKNKIFFVVIYLRDNAFTWFQHFMFDYLNKNRNQRKDETNIIFTDFKTFELRLRRIFKNIDRKITAERQLYNLRQKESTVIYSISFQHIATNTKWDDTALTSQFYQELREKVKNEIARIDRSNNLQEIIIRTIIIDNRQYKRRLKKDKHHSIMLDKKFKEKDYRQSYYESQSIKIDVTQRKFQKTFKRKS